ncbi:MAG: dihydrofolate reductase [Christensenellaceae bacterium]|nr:dihydrofolate reductase [Christensenellaceae bacterium]
MKAILAADLNFGIGKNNELLAHIPEDLKRFKSITMGKPVIMGRKTYESLPGKKPLPGRENIILSRTLESAEGFIVVNSKEELFSILKDPDEAFVIGGGEIYKLLLPYCTDIYLTVIEHIFDADTFFPNITLLAEWELKGVSKTFNHDLIKYHFEDYVRI